MKNPGTAFILAGIAVIGFFILDAVFTSGVSERERHNARQREELYEQQVDELPEADPYAKLREEIFGDGGSADERLTRAEMKYVYESRDMRYTVKPGESLSQIAKKYLGDARMVNELKERNPSLRHGVAPPPGSRIVIPMGLRR